MSKKPFPYLPFIKRDKKPRETGINYVRSPVLVGKTIEDYLEAYGDMIDILKLSGKQAAQINEESLIDFISTCKKFNVMVSIGNPVMDVALIGGRKTVDDYINKCLEAAYDQGSRWVENGYCDAYNIGQNVGRAAGQTIMYPHIHLIPRRKGDIENPRGGVRGVIPSKQKY